jgi:hypothetical protein
MFFLPFFLFLVPLLCEGNTFYSPLLTAAWSCIFPFLVRYTVFACNRVISLLDTNSFMLHYHGYPIRNLTTENSNLQPKSKSNHPQPPHNFFISPSETQCEPPAHRYSPLCLIQL